MNPGEKGWLKEYLEFRKDILKDLTGGAVLTYDTNDINIEELISSSLKE